VGSRFVRRLLGGQPTPPPAVADALGELRRLAEARPSLKTSCTVLEAILPELFGQPEPASPPALESEHARLKMADGVPLLRGEALNLNEDSLRRRWLAVCTAVRKNQGGEAAPELAQAVHDDRLSPPDLLSEVLAGRPETVHARAEQFGLDPALTATVLRLSALPALAGIAEALAPLREVCFWRRGHCPVCGSWPLLGELRGLEQNRFLRCGLCASGWEFARLGCPFCGSRDHRELGYFQVEGEQERFRVTTCDACHGYVKTAFTLAAFTAPQMLVADLASLHLDLAAADRGYFVT
jgi:FdhE protein